MRGRPKTGKRMVAIMIMVPPEVKKGLTKQAMEEKITLSQLVRTILESFHGEYQ